VVHAARLAAPVVALALLGLADRLTVALEPFPFRVPDPVLGPLSPWVTAVLCPLPLLARGRRPWPAALAVFALVLARMLTHDLSTLTFSQFYVAAAVTFLGAAHARRPGTGTLVVAAGTATSLVCMALEEMPYSVYAYSFAALLPFACGLGGLLVRDRVASAERARRAHAQVARAQAARARERVQAERMAAARELHDVVGHAVTSITLQAAVAVRYAPLDLERARRAAAAVAQVASEVERDLARLGASAAPADDLAALTERSGLPVTLDQRVPLSALPLPVAVTTVRIVQEALTNVGRHAGPVPVTVRVDRTREGVLIEVVNGPGRRGVGGGSGRGLPGMRERVEPYAGTLHTGPTDAGGWRVRAELPLAPRCVPT
jgi:signal transduction histidine kinase